MRPRSLIRFLPLCWLAPLAAAPLAAQPLSDAAPDERATPEPTLQPPVLKHAPDPEPPDIDHTEPVRVLLELTIDAEGRVDEAVVIESGDAAFDAAALSAVSRFEFEPARREGEPMAARIRYEIVFPPRVVEAPSEAGPEAAPPVAEPSPDTPQEEIATAPAFAPEELTFGATAEVEAPPREPTKHELDSEQITRIPGTRGDALRAVEILPGVGRTSFAPGPPILRGSASHESLVLLDGAPVPLLYHFGGLTSFFNSRLLGSVELSPGNYSSRYGRASGGLVEANVRDPRSDRFHGALELSLIDTSLLLETPLGAQTSAAVAARRSNIDLVFEQVVPEDAFRVVAAPVYYDYQAIVAHRFDRAHRLRVMGYGSHDRLKLVFSNPNDEDPALRGEVDGVLAFHRLQARLESELSAVVRQSVQLSVGPQHLRQRLGPIDAEMKALDVHGRGDWQIFASPELRIDAGLDLLYQYLDGHYTGSQAQQLEGGLPESLGNERLVSLADTLHIARPGAYLEIGYRPLPEVLLLPGVRADYFEDASAWTVDPRLTTRVDVTRATTLKGGVGLYSQAPEYYEVLPAIGNPDLKPYRALQVSAGVEQTFGRAFELDVEGFYKRLTDRVVSTPGGAPPRLVNQGIGRIYGLELLAKLRPTPQSFAYVAYTLSRSERRDRDEAWRLFDSDQTHNLSLTGNYELGAGWMAGARFRVVTGDPATPIIGATYNATTDLYRPIFGPINSDRFPTFHQLDLRVEKRWDLDPVVLTAYLEVLNVYNAQNAEARTHSFDFSKTEDISGMPIFPNLGVRGEL